MSWSALKIGFNLIGSIYNPVKELVLGKYPEQIISVAIESCQPKGNVLVVGGGADNTVSELLDLKDVQVITLIDISSVLLKEAMQRLKNHKELGKLQLVESSFFDFRSSSQYDYIICPFYLDLFKDDDVRKNINQFMNFLTPKGEVLVIDFANSQDSSIKGKALVAILYSMFFWVTGTVRFTIPPFDSLFADEGFELSVKSIYNDQYQIVSYKVKSP